MSERDAIADRLAEALRRLHDADMDYIKINNLSGAVNNQVLQQARAALADYDASRKDGS